ncbi:cobalamin biosynthesis protein [Pseudomonas profundi]|uniref:cobalamin biosynthesis protein n=1 Tax=Pseudomonas profundi TaxID=1981513 RepID=UPI001CC254D6|nr:cobalamin biosynthesis protein [Pseudomonas profundi]
MHMPVYVAGLGCRKGCSAPELLELLQAALAQSGLAMSELVCLATSEHKQTEAGLLILTDQIGLTLATLSVAELDGYDARLEQRSALSLSITGSAGVAEASALAQAERLGGRPARLLCSKIRSANATCAIAVSPLAPEENA